MQHFHLVILFDLTLTSNFTWYKVIPICYLLHYLGSLLAKYGFSAVISPVLGADEAKSDGFDL